MVFAATTAECCQRRYGGFYCARGYAEALAVERGWLPKGTKMLKRVGGMAGDMYGVNRSRQFYLNDVYIGQASLVDASTVEGTPHIYLKPIAKGAKTNIIINTTHHTYHVECVTLLQRKES